MLLLPATEKGLQFGAQQKGVTAHQITGEEVRVLATVQRGIEQEGIIVGAATKRND